MIRARVTSSLLAAVALVLATAGIAGASEAELILPDLASQRFLGFDGWTLLLVMGASSARFGLVFSFMQFNPLKNLPVHRSMREISELIYETCKTYLITQGKFILMLEVFIGAIMVVYFGVPAAASSAVKVVVDPARSAWSASAAATASPGSASASTPSPTRAPPSPASRASPTRPTPSRSRPA